MTNLTSFFREESGGVIGDLSPVWSSRAVLRLMLLLFVFLLEGCAHTLGPKLESSHTPTCVPDGQDCLARGHKAFEDYRRLKVETIQYKSLGYRLPGAPVAFIHSDRTEYSVLLIHGLNDSAYYMADLGESLHQSGFNVVTVLLPGHGTDTRDMLDVTAEQWRTEVDKGLEMAALVGKKVIVGGFSLGGALAIDAVTRRPDIHGLLLFSPAIKLRSFDTISSLMCAPGLRTYKRKTDLPQNPVKYKYRMGNGACQLIRLMKRNLAESNVTENRMAMASEQLRELARRVKVPTFMALSYADERISPEAALEFAHNVQAPVLVATFGKTENESTAPLFGTVKILPLNDTGLPHSYLVRRSNPYNGQENPCYDRLVSVMTGFLSEQLYLGIGSGDVSHPNCGPISEELQKPD